MSLLEIKNLHIEVEGKQILNDLTLAVEKGQVAAVEAQKLISISLEGRVG